MSVITQETRSQMAQKRFTGTFQEFDEYYQQLKSERVTQETHISVIFEIDEEETLSQEQQAKKECLIKKLQESKADIKAGRTERATPEMFKGLRQEAKEKFLSAK